MATIFEPEAPSRLVGADPYELMADQLFEREMQAISETPLRRPSATYRVQLNRSFRLDDLTAIVGYLAEMGVTDCYLSPYLEAKPGSMHGYDVFDHRRINPEIGDDASHARLLKTLQEHGMSRVLDIVPNHMGVTGHNRFWFDVLENGQISPSARFFDIDWHPVKEELAGRLLLPILEDQYGRVLESGKLELVREGGAFFVQYHDRRLPLAPRSYGMVLEQRSDELDHLFSPTDPRVLEYWSIWASALNLPPRTVTDPRQIEHRLREKEVIKWRIERLCSDSPDLREFIDGNIACFKGQPGDPASFDLLDRLLEEQVYRLAYWRVAAEEINYRRFFDINDLAGLRTEDEAVFNAVHELTFRWVDEGGVTGLRVDHPDGLADPQGYFRRIQETLLLRALKRRLDDEGRGDQWHHIENKLLDRYRRVLNADPASPFARRFPVVAEKILSRGEELPGTWPIDGTVGYEYLNVLNGVFVETAAAGTLEVLYAEFTGDYEPFPDVLHRAKQLIARSSMASEVNMLGRQLNRVSEQDRNNRDFTLNELRRALREVIACFPIYRTYIQPDEPVPPRDQASIEQAIARARRREPTIDDSVYSFVLDTLLLKHPESISAVDRALREQFVIRFQQTTGPMQAKGLEDTVLYRQFRLVSLNDVGADPSRFGNSPSVLHSMNADRLNRWPGSLSTTSTHDTKRGEDTRLRINVISELPEEWRTRLARWSRWNARKKSDLAGLLAPDARDEYLFYQTLLGAWPFEGTEEAPPPGFVTRMQAYMNKAVREAKVHTSWTDPDPSYGEAVARFVAEVLEGTDAGPFLKDFISFQRRVARVAIVHSLAQTVLKIASPGVPDTYQGTELWDLNLVDPDNRRPVDYGLRIRLLKRIQDMLASGASRAEVARQLFRAPEDGAIKLYLIWTLLNHRREHWPLFAQGLYRPLDAEGERKAQVLAFGRHREGRTVIAVVARLVAGLMGDDGSIAPVGPEIWADTRLLLSDTAGPRWRNILTDRIIETRDNGGRSLPIGEVFADLPVALLTDEA